MAVLRSLTPESSYDHLVFQTIKLMLKGTGTNSIVHWVVDTYPIIFKKRSEHARRDDITGILHYSIKCGNFKPVGLQASLVMWFLRQRTLLIFTMCTHGQICHMVP